MMSSKIVPDFTCVTMRSICVVHKHQYRGNVHYCCRNSDCKVINSAYSCCLDGNCHSLLCRAQLLSYCHKHCYCTVLVSGSTTALA
jgi:hypothetical protein